LHLKEKPSRILIIDCQCDKKPPSLSGTAFGGGAGNYRILAVDFDGADASQLEQTLKGVSEATGSLLYVPKHLGNPEMETAF
jgi:hypothetical protein